MTLFQYLKTTSRLYRCALLCGIIPWPLLAVLIGLPGLALPGLVVQLIGLVILGYKSYLFTRYNRHP